MRSRLKEELLVEENYHEFLHEPDWVQWEEKELTEGELIGREQFVLGERMS